MNDFRINTFKKRKLLIKKLSEFEQKYDEFINLQKKRKPIKNDPLYNIQLPHFFDRMQEYDFRELTQVLYPTNAIIEVIWHAFKDQQYPSRQKQKLWKEFMKWFEEKIQVEFFQNINKRYFMLLKTFYL